MVDNADWLDALEYIPFLRDIGPHFTINRMLTFDSVRLRLEREQPLTFLEFNYMILQAYDFLELSRRAACRLQLGGSDQWGNIVNGIELARRVDGTQVYGLTTPLITTADGGKMGKTAAGRGLAQRRPAQPLRLLAILAEHAGRRRRQFLRLFTDLPLDEIARLEALAGAEINEAKKALADAATAMAAWRGGGARGRRRRRAGRSRKARPARRCRRSRSRARSALVDALVGLGLCASKNEARRLIAQGGARVDGEVADEDRDDRRRPATSASRPARRSTAC